MLNTICLPVEQHHNRACDPSPTRRLNSRVRDLVVHHLCARAQLLVGTAIEWHRLIYHEGLTISTNLFGTTSSFTSSACMRSM